MRKDRAGAQRLCADSRDALDDLLSGELPGPQAARVSAHLAGCAGCAGEASRRRRLRLALAAALGGVDPRPRERRLDAVVDQPRAAARQSWTRGAAAAAVALAVGAGLLGRPHDRQPPSRVDPQALEQSVAVHRLCPWRERAVSMRGPAAALAEFAPLLSAVAPAPREVRVLAAHVCPRDGRRFGHVVLATPGGEVSLLATLADRGGLPAAGRGTLHLPGVARPLRTASVGTARVAGLTGPGHLGFVVSELGAEAHARLLAALAPRLDAALARLPEGASSPW